MRVAPPSEPVPVERARSAGHTPPKVSHSGGRTTAPEASASGEARSELEHAERGEAHGAAVGSIRRRIDLSEVE